MEPWMPVVVGLTIYAYVHVFNTMMRHPIRDISEIPSIYASVNK
jgi:hypothetical protein